MSERRRLRTFQILVTILQLACGISAIACALMAATVPENDSAVVMLGTSALAIYVGSNCNQVRKEAGEQLARWRQ